MPILTTPKLLLVTATLSLLAGCSSSSYIPPLAHNIATETTTTTAYQNVWDGLVKNLSTSGLTVRALDSNNHKMRMLIKSTMPETYVDCGNQIISDKNFAQINTNPIQALTYTQFEDDSFIQIVRQPGLHAYINILLTPLEHSTKVSVDVNYEIFGKNKTYDSNKRFLSSEKINYHLSSQKPFKGELISCVSKGVIENQVIEAVL